MRNSVLGKRLVLISSIAITPGLYAAEQLPAYKCTVTESAGIDVQNPDISRSLRFAFEIRVEPVELVMPRLEGRQQLKLIEEIGGGYIDEDAYAFRTTGNNPTLASSYTLCEKGWLSNTSDAILTCNSDNVTRLDLNTASGKFAMYDPAGWVLDYPEREVAYVALGRCNAFWD